VQSGADYTLSMFVGGSASPVLLHLLADGAVIPPSSSVDPDRVDPWQELSRTYEAVDLGAYVGQDLSIVLGLGRPAPDGASGTQAHFDDVTLHYSR
jgi:hypothetical protein